MAYEAKNFGSLLGMQELSDSLLNNHFILYQGYVNNTKKLMETAGSMAAQGKTETPEFAEIKRRIGWEFNGMRLHELYFSNIVKGGNIFGRWSKLNRKINEDFGSYENWEREFKAIGMMRGIGWVVLCYDPLAKKLINIWVNEHDAGHLAGTVPLLVMDMFEHAYMPDYGLKKSDYIGAFFKLINWGVVESRM